MVHARSSPRFSDRKEAGHRLAEKVKALGLKNPLVYAIPRGGVSVAWELATHLRADMDLLLAHKFTSSAQSELALGSVTDAGDVWLGAYAGESGLTEAQLKDAARKEIGKLKRKRQKFGAIRESTDPQGRDVIIVDDGIVTGATVIAAVRSLRARQAGRIVIASPVASQAAVERLRSEGAELCLALVVPQVPFSVRDFYDDFRKIDDEELASILREAEERARKGRKLKRARGPISETRDIQLGGNAAEVTGSSATAGVTLRATLRVPDRAKGIVVFVTSGRIHGMQNKPRAQAVSRALNQVSLATVHIEIQEELSADRWRRILIEPLGEQVLQAIDWIKRQPELSTLPIGLYGVSAGSAAALVAAGRRPQVVRAVVSRGGRPDLAAESLPHVKAATLLIVGEEDRPVASLNRSALKEIAGERALVLVPGAGHLFNEPGSMEEVARLTQSWFERFLFGSKEENPVGRNEAPPPSLS